jgi:hypothetical protein
MATAVELELLCARSKRRRQTELPEMAGYVQKVDVADFRFGGQGQCLQYRDVIADCEWSGLTFVSKISQADKQAGAERVKCHKQEDARRRLRSH